ncbi:MAG: glycoside hydrolase family 65 protein, partial [Acidimicrobiia bacterium]
MIPRSRNDLPPDVYPPDPWGIVEEAFSPRFLALTETIFSLANGYLGIRGTLDEGRAVYQHGTYLNGFHETWPIIHPEWAYGLATTGQAIVNAPDATSLTVSVDGEAFRLTEAEIVSYRRWLDFRSGVLERKAQWRTRSGRLVELWWRRLVSLTDRHLAAFMLELGADGPCVVELGSRLANRQDLEMADPGDPYFDPRRGKAFGHRVLEEVGRLEGDRIVRGWVTARSRMGLAVAVDHLVQTPRAHARMERPGPDDSRVTISLELDAGEPLRLTKLTAYHSSSTPEVERLMTAASLTLDAVPAGFDGLADAQAAELAGFWEEADVVVEAGPAVQQAVRWTLFQLHQASALLDQTVSIPAKGLTGQAYDGHYFWDTEIYVLPLLTYTRPALAAGVLRFRHSILGHARVRAGELSQRGALYPWRTITGEEASAYYEAGTAQYHINADIVYALRKYVQVTGDEELLWEAGAEIAVETARMWADLGFFRADRFHIHGVTGPDEYSALVDDNAYTNLMARLNMRYASEVVDRMKAEQPERFTMLAGRLGIDQEEVVAWRLAADAIYVHHDPDLGITAQDAEFLEKEMWDFAATPPDKYPLLLHFHPLVIYRFQVLKQADLVLATFLLGEEFTPAVKKANFDYYDPLTTGDSSLSASVQAIVAAEIGYAEQAMEYFQHALFMDLADLAGNTADGAHM